MALRSRIPAVRARLAAAQSRGVARAAGMVLDLAQQLCPVDTGALRASGRVEPEGPAPVVRVVFGGGRVGYARFIEFGTARSAAQPFLTPAARAIDVRLEVAKEVSDYLKGA